MRWRTCVSVVCSLLETFSTAKEVGAQIVCSQRLEEPPEGGTEVVVRT